MRWAAGRIRPFLVTASPRAGRHRHAPAVTFDDAGPRSDLAGDDGDARSAPGGGSGVLRLPPRGRRDADAAVGRRVRPASIRFGARDRTGAEPGGAARHPAGPCRAHGGDGAQRLGGGTCRRRRGDRVAFGGVGAVRRARGGRGASTSTTRRCRRNGRRRGMPATCSPSDVDERGVPLVLVSPAPTLTAVVDDAGAGGVVHPPRARERAGWPAVTVVDRSDEDPWKRSLRHVAADRPAAHAGPAHRLRVEHHRPGAGAGVPQLPGVAAVRAMRRRRRPRRRRPTALSSLRHRATAGVPGVRPVGLRQPAPRCHPSPRGTRRRVEPTGGGRHRVVERAARPGGDPRRHRGRPAPHHRCRRRGLPRVRLRDARPAVPRRRAGDGAHRREPGRDRAGGADPDVHAATTRCCEPPSPATRRSSPRANACAGAHAVAAAVRRARPSVGRRLRRVRRARWRRRASTSAEASISTSCGPTDWMTLGERLNATERPPGSKIRIEVDPPRV